MIADSVDELIEFAVSIGLAAEWFQPKSSPHFDLTVEGRRLAVQSGAIELSQRELVQKLPRDARKQFTIGPGRGELGVRKKYLS